MWTSDGNTAPLVVNPKTRKAPTTGRIVDNRRRYALDVLEVGIVPELPFLLA